MHYSVHTSSHVISRVTIPRAPLHSRTASLSNYSVRPSDSSLTGSYRRESQWRPASPESHVVSSYATTSLRFRSGRQSRCVYNGDRCGLGSHVRQRNPTSSRRFGGNATITRCAEAPVGEISRTDGSSDAGGTFDDKMTKGVGLRRKRRRSAASVRIIGNDDQSLDKLTDSVETDAGPVSAGGLRATKRDGRDKESSFAEGSRLQLRRMGTDTSSSFTSAAPPMTSSSVVRRVDPFNNNESNDLVRRQLVTGKQTLRSGQGQRFAASRLVPPVPAGQQLLGRWQVSFDSRKDPYRVLQSSGSTTSIIDTERISGVSGSEIEPRSTIVDRTSSSITSSTGTTTSATSSGATTSATISSATRTATSSSNSSVGRLFPYLPWPGGQVIIEGDAEAEAAADAAVEAETLERRQRGMEQAKKRVYGPRSDEERRRMSEGRRELERRTGHLSRIARERFADPDRKERLRAAMLRGYYEKDAPSKISAKAKERCADPAFRQLIGRAMTGLPFHCTACGQVGHRRNFCPSLGYVKQDRAKKGLRDPMQCSNCGKLGHNRRSCKGSIEHATEGSRLADSAAVKGVKQERARNGLKRVMRCSSCGSIGHNRRTCNDSVNRLQSYFQHRNAEPS